MKRLGNIYVNKKVNINSVFIGIMLSCNILSPVFDFIPHGIAFVVFVPFLFLVKENFSVNISINKLGIIFVFVYFLIYFLFSLIKGNFNEYTIRYITEFIVLGIPLFIVSQLDFDPKIVLRIIAFLSVLVLPVHLININLEFVSYLTDSELMMTISYNLVKMIVSGVLLLFLERNIFVLLILLVLVLLPSYFLINVGARGAILSLVISVILSFIYINNKPIKVFSFKVFSILAILVLLLFNFSDIIFWLYDLFNEYDIRSIALERVVDMIDNDLDLTTGRDTLLDVAILGFMDSPIIGNGIGSFDNYSGFYPHNLFLQQIYEGGVVFGFPILIITLLSFYFLNSNVDRIMRFFLIYLITTSVVHLFFSSYFWSSSIYWFLIGLTIRCIISDNLNYSLEKK